MNSFRIENFEDIDPQIDKKRLESEFARYNELIKDLTYPRNFKELYLRHCLKIKDLPLRFSAYEELDRAMEMVNETEQSKKNFTRALNPDRICIAIPLIMISDKLNKFYCDGYNETNEPFYLSDPLTDEFRIQLINFFTGDVEEIDWKIGRLIKVLTMGWDNYVAQYR